MALENKVNETNNILVNVKSDTPPAAMTNDNINTTTLIQQNTAENLSQEQQNNFNSQYIILIIAIIIIGAFIYFIIKFRKRFAILNEFLEFLWKEKLWWMIPLILILLLLGILIFFGASNTALAPFIYPLF